MPRPYRHPARTPEDEDVPSPASSQQDNLSGRGPGQRGEFQLYAERHARHLGKPARVDIKNPHVEQLRRAVTRVGERDGNTVARRIWRSQVDERQRARTRHRKLPLRRQRAELHPTGGVGGEHVRALNRKNLSCAQAHQTGSGIDEKLVRTPCDDESGAFRPANCLAASDRPRRTERLAVQRYLRQRAPILGCFTEEPRGVTVHRLGNIRCASEGYRRAVVWTDEEDRVGGRTRAAERVEDGGGPVSELNEMKTSLGAQAGHADATSSARSCVDHHRRYGGDQHSHSPSRTPLTGVCLHSHNASPPWAVTAGAVGRRRRLRSRRRAGAAHSGAPRLGGRHPSRANTDNPAGPWPGRSPPT